MRGTWNPKKVFSPFRLRFILRAILGSVVLIGITISGSEAFAWTITADFESGTVGKKAVGQNAFHGAGSLTTFSNQQRHSGSQSARMDWQQGDDGFSNARGDFNFPVPVGIGQEIWGRMYVYFKSPWSWKAATTANCGCRLKTLRFHKKQPDGSNGGYADILMNLPSGTVMGGVEFSSAGNLFTNLNLVPDRWYALELYTKLHPTNGIIRIWVDANLVVDKRNFDTASPTGAEVMDFAYIMGYWNGGAPQNQTQYIDDIIITTDRPANQDAQGNPMIGLGPAVVDTAPPRAPTGLKIQ